MDTTSAPMNAAVAAVLRAERVVLGLSHADLEERTGIPKVSIQRYLAGTRPLTIDTVYALAGALEMSLEHVIGEAQRRMPMFTAPAERSGAAAHAESGHVRPSAEGIESTMGPTTVLPGPHPQRMRRTDTLPRERSS